MWLVDFLFPKWCVGCKKYGTVICEPCKKKLIYIQEALCISCQKPNLHGFTHRVCRKTCPIDGTVVIFRYDLLGKRIIKRFKYGLQYRDFVDIISKLSSSWQEELRFIIHQTPNFVLQPIPLHFSRLKHRGFNQAKIIADYIHSIYGLKVVDYLVRVRNTNTQAYISNKWKRKKNVKNAFSVDLNNRIVDKNIILIDDLYTSGATAQEAAKELRKHGCNKVYLFTIAHGYF